MVQRVPKCVITKERGSGDGGGKEVSVVVVVDSRGEREGVKGKEREDKECMEEEIAGGRFFGKGKGLFGVREAKGWE